MNVNNALQSEDYLYEGDTYCLQRFDLSDEFELYVLDEDDEWEPLELDEPNEYYDVIIDKIKQENNWIA